MSQMGSSAVIEYLGFRSLQVKHIQKQLCTDTAFVFGQGETGQKGETGFAGVRGIPGPTGQKVYLLVSCITSPPPTFHYTFVCKFTLRTTRNTSLMSLVPIIFPSQSLTILIKTNEDQVVYMLRVVA